jgi:histidine triad (HIT) family protein
MSGGATRSDSVRDRMPCVVQHKRRSAARGRVGVTRRCVFCAIVAGQAEASVVGESERALAVLDIQPVTAGHTLVVPRTHAARLAELEPVDGAEVFRLGQRVAAALYASNLRADGVNFFLADGQAAGQEVFHVHLHVLPRFSGDGFGLRLPDDYRVRERAELDEVAARIRAAWQ